MPFNIVDFLTPGAPTSEAYHRGETVFLYETNDFLEIALHVDGDAMQQLSQYMQRLDGDFPWQAYCLAVEGVSHILRAAFCATYEHSLRLVDLELQGDIDKYICAVLPPPQLGEFCIAENPYERLFEQVRFIDDALDDQGRRYRDSHRFAASFVRNIHSTRTRQGIGAMLTLLRRHYRSDPKKRLHHHWEGA